MSAQRRIIDRLDAEPHLFPAGTIGRLLSAHAASISAQSLTLPAPGSKPQDAHHTLGEVYASRSWRATAGLRLAGRAARRVRNRLRRP